MSWSAAAFTSVRLTTWLASAGSEIKANKKNIDRPINFIWYILRPPVENREVMRFVPDYLIAALSQIKASK
jgi:hypothetical protein